MAAESRRDAKSGDGSKYELKTSKLERIAPKVKWPDGRGITYLHVTATLNRAGTEEPCWRGIPDDRSNVERFDSNLELNTSKVERIVSNVEALNGVGSRPSASRPPGQLEGRLFRSRSSEDSLRHLGSQVFMFRTPNLKV
jgi:hypothetical protein